MIGIICAIPEELEGLKGLMGGPAVHRVWAWDVYEGRINGADVALVMSGVGKVNAALAVYLLTDRFSVGTVVSAGIAGIIDRELTLGDIVIAQDMTYHDCHHHPSTQRSPGDLVSYMSQVFVAPPPLVTCAIDALTGRMPEIPERLLQKKSRASVKMGRVVSGDMPVTKAELANSLRERYRATCVDMEAAAIAQACTLRNLQFIVVRIMSDYANETAYVYMLRYGRDLGTYLARVVSLIVHGLPDQPHGPSSPAAVEGTTAGVRVD